ncbi:MAG: preprotein translocase subunit SecA [Christensenellaceae bacterium]|jgi:preprotein translocase subunit SecA|nr:preprotein translocase subunit SecA [Christensenellaceae bacterium]
MGLFGNDNARHLKKISRIADKVLDLEEVYKAKTDAELIGMTATFKQRLSKGETLDDILPEAFATVREAGWRVLGQRAYPVQIMGGICLHQGRIAEMKTGEGKTLVSTMPAYLNALKGNGVHIVEVNEYLARRNSEWMGKVHRFLGLTVGLSRAHTHGTEKQKAYACDITYVTSSEVGFDYLRDNCAHSKDARCLRGLNFAIVDEVDSILIDESRTPLIMSAPTKDNSDLYKVCDKFVRTLKDDDYEIDLKERAVRLTEEGIAKAERAFGLDNISSAENMELNHFIDNALRAHHVFIDGADYLVSKDGEILIVDQNTGRAMVGRRYSDGLHQAIEAKEGVKIKNEDKTIATITIQNLFKLYKKLSGMTGTAKTEETEFQKIYGVDVVCIPTNRTTVRDDAPDVIFQNMDGKLSAIYEDVIYRFERKQPVLIGTTTIDKSEQISRYLKQKGIPHTVLNAKNHEQEADIVAQAGKLGAVTIATNMAGRGTDILLGGNPDYLARQALEKEGLDAVQIADATSFADTDNEEILSLRKRFKEHYDKFKKITNEEKLEVQELGGLHIIGTERHDSRRIDNQLRGRAGRQGDPGSSIFYISCEDEIIKRFGKDVIGGAMRFMNLDDVQSRLMTNLFERVQKRVEGFYFDARRNTFQYDNVMNDQRELIYKERNRILDGVDVHEQILQFFPDIVSKITREAIDYSLTYREWDLEKANQVLGSKLFGEEVQYLTAENTLDATPDEVEGMILDAMTEKYEEKIEKVKENGIDFKKIERDILLQIVDKKWTDHIDAMMQLRSGIGLRGYGQKDPLIEYRREAIVMFNNMIESINNDVALFLFKVNVEVHRATPMPVRKPAFAMPQGTVKTDARQKQPDRNDPCPCGSGKKYKNCCGAK